jgi:hypothetical protein
MSAVEQFSHQVGADESGASGDEHAAKIGGQRRITHAGEHK